MNKMNNYIKSKSTLLFLIAALVASFVVVSMPKPVVAAIATAGCYKIDNGKPIKLSSCPTSNVTYDNSKGANISKPDPTKCYVYSANLYDGSKDYGEPYTEQPCDKLVACPSGQELRYNTNASNAPICVATTAPTSDTYNAPASNNGLKTVNPLGNFKANPDAGKLLEAKNTKTCGSGTDNEVKVAFDFGCAGPEYCDGKSPDCVLNPIVDVAFAIFRFLSAGVGLIVIGSIIVAGLQYSASRGNPQATQAAIKRITSSIVALLIYIFIFAFANYLVPGGMFL